MCTVSWLHQNDEYLLLCNRDEKRTRANAFGPQIQTRKGVRFLAPTDVTGGGTWIGTNEYGISLCLLNGRPSRRKCSGRIYKSRGLLLPDLLSASSATEASGRVWQLALSPFAPFNLAILEPGQHTSVIEWDGREKAILPYAEPYMPLVSSSFDPDGVQSKRRDQFRHLRSAGKLDFDVLLAFHESHGAEPDAYSPCMHRSDAETVSFSCVKVTDAEVQFFYSPRAPCFRYPGETRKLPLLR